MKYSETEYSHSQTPVPDWLQAVSLKVKKNNFVSNTLARLQELDSLSAKIIQHGGYGFDRAFSFRFTEPNTHAEVDSHYDVVPKESVIAFETTHTSKAERLFRNNAGRLAFSMKSIFSGFGFPEIVLDTEEDRKDAETYTTCRADIDIDSGDIRSF